MKSIKYIFTTVLAALSLAACDNDGDRLYINQSEDAILNGNTEDIVLDYANDDALALTVYWTDNGKITLSNPDVSAPQNAYENTLQLSASEDFSMLVSVMLDKGQTSKQFTVKELNDQAAKLGMEAGVRNTLYLRLSSVLGGNMQPRLSNVMTVGVTPYRIYMNYGNVLNSDRSDSGRTLYSANEDGVYAGFLGVNGWYNWYLQEANGVTWGNIGDDGGGKPFVTSSNDLKWNYWFPGMSGCYYTVVDTRRAEWSALYLPAIAIGGDLTGDMTYNQKTNAWYYTFNASAGTYNVTLSGNGKQYNAATGTDDAAAIDTPFGFGGNAAALSFGETPSSITITIETAGETTLTLDLSNSAQWTLTVVSGAPEIPNEVSKHIWMPGVDDGISGAWTFDNYLTLYNEDALGYGGACNINSLWGYYYTPQADWGEGFGYESGDAYEGKLNNSTANNIPSPEPGLYIMDVSLSVMTYKLTAITSVSYTGLNDDWSVAPMTHADGCIYEAQVTKYANTPWGVKILINESWDLFFGGGSGELRLYADGFDGDNDLPNGAYTLRVDLGKGTYEYIAQ